MDNDKDLEKLKIKTGIEDFESVSTNQFESVQRLAAEDKISKEDMRLLVDVIPNFVQLQQTYVDGLKTLVDAAKETQKDALQGISGTLTSITDILQSLVDKAETEELRFKIADISLKLADYGLEIAKILQDTNKDNNKIWKDIGVGIVSAITVTGVAFVTVLIANKSKKGS